jgi:hypothetical protein
VSQTGAGVEASNELGEQAFTARDGRPLQRFPIHDAVRAKAEQAEAMATIGVARPSPAEPGPRPWASAQQGVHLDVAWSFQPTAERTAMLTIAGRQLHLYADALGGWITHEMAGRWSDPAVLARNIIRFHPDFSPLARPPLA